ncbi:hypothetical protein PSN13_04013 [Micromonospora saelicesensis]|uniref:Uncharacterized protein n=1 Tax=Micromonospora saelicesensis TaxID=285676 RepID=A0A328NNT8_9ACTN|nr:hypothetical protein PSN13_04013 [Micromonospora saelicesensis]
MPVAASETAWYRCPASAVNVTRSPVRFTGTAWFVVRSTSDAVASIGFRTVREPLLPAVSVIRLASRLRHSVSTVTLPRARRPLTEPVGQAAGTAGSTSTTPFWLCSSISAIPAVAPKLPSIWNGGWVSNRLARVLLLSCSLSILWAWSPSSSRAQKLIFQALLQPVPPSPRAVRETRAALARAGVVDGDICRPGCRAYRCETCRWSLVGLSQSAFHSCN